jgi:hypothetical protein
MATLEERLGNLAGQRERGRKQEFERARERHIIRARKSRAYMLGRDEDGKPRETRSIADFPVIVDKWFVHLGFSREDGKKLKEMSLTEIEARLKKGSIPRMPVGMNTHIITAVRALKHIHGSYLAELEEADLIIGVLQKSNLAIVEKKCGYTEQDIEGAIKQLEDTDKLMLARKQAAPKRIARGRIKKTVKMLEDAKAMPPGNKRDRKVWNACAVYASAPVWLGKHRDKDVAGKMEYNLQKEFTLRHARDVWLFSQMAKFARYTEDCYGYWAMDMEKLAVLGEIRKRLRGRKDKGDALAFIKEKNPLFRVSERKREHAEERIELMESGVMPGGRGKVDFQIGHYALLYRYVREGRIEAARRKIDHLDLFVKANKPGFILGELKELPDSYLAPVIEELGKAVAAFEAKELDAAKTHFTNAQGLMNSIVNPRKPEQGNGGGHP